MSRPTQTTKHERRTNRLVAAEGLMGAAFWLAVCFCVLMLAGLLHARWVPC